MIYQNSAWRKATGGLKLDPTGKPLEPTVKIKRLRKGSNIKFKCMNEFTGDEMIYKGTVLGNEKAVRKQFPVECGGATNCHLVKRVDNFGNDFLHVVYPEEIIEEV